MNKIIFSKQRRQKARQKLFRVSVGVMVVIGIAFAAIQYRYGQFIRPYDNGERRDLWGKALGVDFDACERIFLDKIKGKLLSASKMEQSIRCDLLYSRDMRSFSAQSYVVNLIKHKFFTIKLAEIYIQAEKLEDGLRREKVLSNEVYSKLTDKISSLYYAYLNHKWYSQEHYDLRRYPERVLLLETPEVIKAYEEFRVNWYKHYNISIVE